MYKMQEFECPVCQDRVERLVQTQELSEERHNDECTGCTAILVPVISPVKGRMR